MSNLNRDMLKYSIPSDVHASHQERPLLSTPQGGSIALDPIMLSLWEQADGHTLNEILDAFQAKASTPDHVRAGLACLVEAGALLRDGRTAAENAPAAVSGNLVSVIIVSLNSKQWLRESIPSLLGQTYSPIEIIVVDNASADGSGDWIRESYSNIRLISLAAQKTFARAINEGISQAKGEYFLLLNPDVRLAPDAVAQMMLVAQKNPDCAAVAAKLKLWWAPQFLNGLGNYVGAVSWGTDNALGHLDLGQFDKWVQVPSACFASTLIPRKAWNMVGAVDEAFPMYYEDSEWCYRARLLGHKIVAAPNAKMLHAFGGRAPTGQEVGLTSAKLRNVAFGRLRFALKLVGLVYLWRFLANYFIEDWTNSTRTFFQRDWETLRAYWGAWSDFIKSVPSIWRTRRALQQQRVVSDRKLFAMHKTTRPPFIWHGLPELTWDLIGSHYMPLILSGETKPMPEFDGTNRRPHLLIVSHEIVDAKMAGPGMRYLEMARALSSDVDVTLAIPSETTLDDPAVPMVRYSEERPASLRVLVENSDVALISGYMITKFPFLENSRARLVVDLYDPFILENLHYYLNEPLDVQKSYNDHAVTITNELAEIGDFFICGSERQRDFWTGLLAANGRVNPSTFSTDPSLSSLIQVVGIGIPDREPQGHPLLRGVRTGFPSDCQIVLWGGGIWDWLDPLTLIRAWRDVLAKHPKARLVFLGTRHPNPLVPTHKMAERAQALAAEIGEKDHSIFFFEWLSYEDRERLLSEANVGVTLHPQHIETRYSIRTRVLDYFWARLPILVSDGDVTSDWVRQYQVGRVVQPLDVGATAQALDELLTASKESWRPAFDRVQSQFLWKNVVEPLRRYCLEGRYAPDRERTLPSQSFSGWLAQGRVVRALYIWRTEGFRVFMHRVWRYFQWGLGQP